MVSMNFDQRSKRLNTEIGLIIESPRGEGQRLLVRFLSFLPLDRAL
jgi:phosphatidylserine/phosphatidylglycerophosphate/cardiolipin synthase-like enzyme